MPISHKHKTIFVHNPRCAGASMVDLFDDMRTLENLYGLSATTNATKLIPADKFSDYDYRKCSSKSPRHYSLQEIKKIISEDVYSNYKKISVVRNPYERFVSGYNASYFSKHLGFEEYMVYILKLNELERIWMFDSHNETQLSFLKNEQGNLEDLDIIYKFESLAMDVPNLLNTYGKKDFFHKNKSKKMRLNYMEYYNKVTAEILYIMYKEDFESFGYEKINL
jgi:hypothetical protein